jgi:hypothetical protein
MKTKEAIPNPAALMESMREIGYSTDSAIADLIDNSITAKCKEINVRYNWSKGKPWIAVIDDGIGMNSSELLSAMHIGSINPLDARDKDDLGRFGLGLKTASLSQSRKFTVLSKKNKVTSIAQWDLDSLDISKNNKWSIILLEENELKSELNELNNKYLKSLKDGTIVFWDNIDRIDVGELQNKKEMKFNSILSNVRTHLELVFHRFLTPSLGKRKIKIKYNESSLEPFDPFFIKRSKELPTEEINYEGSKISVQPFVLPHHSKVSKNEYKKYEGRRGYLNEQGFYIYRNRRLIIYANWFRLIPKKEMTKLIRVRIDIPNTIDHLWKIDVKKSNAMPPQFVRAKLSNIISKIEVAGVRVYRHKGQKLISNIKDPAWERIAKESKIFYKINIKHPLVQTHLKGLSNKQKEITKDLFSVLENSFPQDMYFNDVASNPEEINPIELTILELESILLKYYINNKNPSKSRLNEILLTDPFAKNIEMTKEIFKKQGYEF